MNDKTDLAGKMGIFPDELPKTLDYLWYDVAGESQVLDGHPRFGLHLALLGWSTTRWSDLDAQSDAATTDVEFNAITRQAIARIREL